MEKGNGYPLPGDPVRGKPKGDLSLKPFYIVVKDRDRKTFCFKGPIEDDTEINETVAALQKQGRRINCHTVQEADFEAVRQELTLDGWSIDYK